MAESGIGAWDYSILLEQIESLRRSQRTEGLALLAKQQANERRQLQAERDEAWEVAQEICDAFYCELPSAMEQFLERYPRLKHPWREERLLTHEEMWKDDERAAAAE